MALNYILKEPMYFGLYWNLNQPKSESITNQINTFHSNNCLKFENYFDTNDAESYFTYNISNTIQRKLIHMTLPGMVTVTARKIDDIKHCQNEQSDDINNP